MKRRRVFYLRARSVETGKTRHVEGWGPFYDGNFATAVADDLSNRLPAWSYYVCPGWEKQARAHS